MLEVLQSLFAEGLFIPHGHCYLWKPGLVWLHIISDTLIALAYYSIPITLIYFVQKRRDLPFDWIFLLFGAFIILCGTTHIIEVWTLWHPVYWVSGLVKAVTAGISVCTAVILVPTIFKALALPSPAQLEAANRQLEAEIIERTSIEEQLRSYQKMLQLVMDNIPQFIFWKDRNSVFLGSNRNFTMAAGFDNPEDIVGKTDYDLSWKKEEADLYRRCDTRVMETDTPEYRIIETQRQANGKQAWLETNKIPFHDAQGNVIGILGSSEDITERKLAQEALEKAKEELEIRVEERTSQIQQVVKHLQSEIEERKQAEEDLRKSEARFREVACREALLNRLASLIRNSLDLDTMLETAVQEIYNQLKIDVCLFAWYRQQCTPSGWDVVKEVKNPALPSFLGLYPIDIWSPFTCKIVNFEAFQVDNDTETACDVQQRLLPFGKAELLSLPIQTQSGDLGAVMCGRLVSSPSWTDEELELLQAVTNQMVIGINQGQLYEQSRIAATEAQTKATELEVALRELQQAQAHLIQTEKMSSLGQLVAGVAHEINNPINFIYGNITHADQYAQNLLKLMQLYQEFYPDPPSEIQVSAEAMELDFIKVDLPKLLSSMKMGAERICQIVSSLKNFSRADLGQMSWVDIHKGLDSTLLILTNRLKANGEYPGIEIIKEYGDLPEVQGCAGQLDQVFMNILTNAIDAINGDKKERSSGGTALPSRSLLSEHIKSSPGMIRIRTEVNDTNSVIIRIFDNGSGMTEEVQRRLFDPFFTTKPVGSGTGLGMSISYQIVEKHGGQLKCTSAPSQGTEFSMYLPIEQLNFRSSQEAVA